MYHRHLACDSKYEAESPQNLSLFLLSFLQMDPQNRENPLQQLSFEFAGNSTDGLALWREQQRAEIRRLGMELGLPIGSICEVVLRSGIQLRGHLVLDEPDLFHYATRKHAFLRIGVVSFSISEIADCVRLE
jgi:hypothetical protein